MSKEVALEIVIPADLANGSVQSLEALVLHGGLFDRFTHIDRLEWARESTEGEHWYVYGKGNDAD